MPSEEIRWHNKITDEYKSGNPWGYGYFNPEKIVEYFPDWEKVVDFVLPVQLEDEKKI